MSDTNNSFAPGDPPSSAGASHDASRSLSGRTPAILASFNVLHGRIANGPVDLVVYADIVAGLGADFVGLQEVDKGMLRTSRADMAAVAGKRAGMVSYFGKAARRFDLGLYGLAVLAKGRLVAQRIRLPRNSWLSERRIAIEAQIEVGGTQWTVVNTHLSLNQQESETQLRFLLQRFGHGDKPTVLMGDFNRRPEQVVPLISGDWILGDSGHTYPSWKPEQRIDFMVARNATIEQIDVRSTPLSDHCALVARATPS